MLRTSAALAVLFALLLPLCAAGATLPHHALVRLELDSPAARDYLQRHLAELDILFVKPGVIAEIAVQPEQLQRLQEAGLPLRIVEEDMEGAPRFAEKAVGFGAYHTYAENTAFLDSLRVLYPGVISQKWSIGQSHLGNDLWCIRVSDNPDVDEDEPEILLDGMHHAREIMASEFPILFAEYLAQNYGVDEEITWLLDHRELYIVPICNPDGVLFNEATNPGGGGMWRKNRRDNGDGTYGVDTNRNYPYQWGFDDSGSSPYPSEITYRGPSAGSEPEVQAIMDLFDAHDFVTHNTYHSYSNLTLYPWGYVNAPTPDESAFLTVAERMVRYNGYTPGRPGQLLYPVNGGTIDWAYGTAGVLSFSNEIGASGDGFWPPESRRIPLFEENIWPARVLMRSADAFVVARDPATAPVAKNIGAGQAGLLDFTLENEGAGPAPGGTITLRTDDAWLLLEEAQRSLPALAAFGQTQLGASAIPFSVEAGCPDGHFALVEVEIPQTDAALHSTLSIQVGEPAPLLTEDFESGATDWTLTGGWALSGEAAYDGSFGLTDSPGAGYDDDTNWTATLNPALRALRFSFRQRYSIEEGWDYGYVQVSTDGASWNTVYSCTGTRDTWETVEIDLTAYAGSALQFRFLLSTDTYVTDDGWFIDDVLVEGFDARNEPPTTPEVAAVAGLPSEGPTPIVALVNSTDPEGEPLTYGFRVYADSLGTQPVLAQTGVEEGSFVTEFTITGLDQGDYWWRGWAFDGVERSLMSPATPVRVHDGSPVGDAVVMRPGLSVPGGVTGGQARLQLTVPNAGAVTVDVFDARGARVRSLHTGQMDSGSRTLVWDGRDATGRDVASGVYLVRMLYAGEAFTGRVVMVR